MATVLIYLKSGQTIQVRGNVQKITEADLLVDGTKIRYKFDLERGQYLDIDQREITAVLSVDECS